MGDLWQDLRHGVRMLKKNPGFTALAVLTLALGIGANTAIFSVVNAVLLEPLPYRDPASLVFIWSTWIPQGLPSAGSSAPDFRDWRDENHVFTDMAAFAENDYDLAVPDQEPSRIHGARVTANLFALLGVGPSLGRDFVPDEEKWGPHHVVLLSYGLWQARFGGDSSVLGRTIHLDKQEYTVVGVMPRGMPFFSNAPPSDLWVPLAFAPDDGMNTRRNHYLNVVARLKPRASAQLAQGQMTTIAKNIENAFPENRGIGAKVVAAREQLVGSFRLALLILLATVTFVLLIACVNIANLMLARATGRKHEFAVRSALGASRRRLLWQMSLEGIPLAFLGGAGGVVIALWGMKLLASLIPSDLPRFNPVGMSGDVLIFTTGMSLLAVICFAFAPAVHASKAEVRENLSEGGRGGKVGSDSRHFQDLLVVFEVALALLLLVGAGLLIKTLSTLRHTDPGFSPDHVLTLSIPLSAVDFPKGSEEKAIQVFQDVIRRVNALQDVTHSGVTTTLPLGFGGWVGKDVDLRGHTPPTSLDKVPIVRFELSSVDYMPAIGSRLVSGRFFTDQDNRQSPAVALINKTFARQFFPNEDAIGKSIRMLPPLNLLPPEDRAPELLPPWRTIVGVIADMKDRTMNQPALPTVFAPYFQHQNESWGNNWMFAVRTSGDPLASVAAIRDQIHSLLPNQPVDDITTMAQLLSRSLSRERFSMVLLSIFAGLALVLAAIGIYGVMTYVVAQKTREMGIRLALGAQPSDVLRLILGHGAKLALAGVLIGMVSGFGLTRLMASLLYGVSPTDLVTFFGVAILLMLVAVAAGYIPAHRATKVDPGLVLRCE